MIGVKCLVRMGRFWLWGEECINSMKDLTRVAVRGCVCVGVWAAS